jgi:hypothetical protein
MIAVRGLPRGSREAKNVNIRAEGHGTSKESALAAAKDNARYTARRRGLGPVVGIKGRPKTGPSGVKGMPFRAEVVMIYSPSSNR